MTEGSPRRSPDIDRAIEAVWRIESARLIAGLTRTVHDVALAEDMAQDALVAAMEQWPVEGIPSNPGAWLAAVGRRRAIDALRRRASLERKHGEIGQTIAAETTAAIVAASAPPADEAELDDDLLRLVFLANHPVLSMDARVALTLRLLGGLTTEEIARAFLVPEATLAQRIVRAKRTLNEAHVPFEVPAAADLPGRLRSVLEVIYLIFNEGYSATTGDSWMRPGLGEEALRLGRMVAELVPSEPEVRGLIALMELQASRFAARVGPDGEPVLLLDQDRRRWDRLLIERGLRALDRAIELGGTFGPYTLQASIAACHARARTADETDWVRISALYDALAEVAPSPIVELNRAVAVSMAFGPSAGLELIDRLVDEPQLRAYHLLPSVRGDLLERLGRLDEAAAEFRRAADLTRNERERDLLLARAASASATSEDA